jgi:hypothetical protein
MKLYVNNLGHLIVATTDKKTKKTKEKSVKLNDIDFDYYYEMFLSQLAKIKDERQKETQMVKDRAEETKTRRNFA